MNHFLTACYVFAALTLVYVAAPYYILSLRIHGPLRVAVSTLAALAVQACLGWFHNQMQISPNAASLAAYTAVLFSLRLVWRSLSAPDSCTAPDRRSSEYIILVIILLAALLYRWIHPLTHAALGQSDAYSHLQFLTGVLNNGHIPHPLYPPGYHWILALPSWLFQLDPYNVARYAGAFFGCLLVLHIYLLGRAVCGRYGGLIAALITAAFPGLQVLAKTGVGAFPNQLGLACIPLMLYLIIRRHQQPWIYGSALAAGCCLLAVSVPMMLITLTVTVGVMLLLEAALAHRVPLKNWAPVITAFLIGGGCMGLHFSQSSTATDIKQIRHIATSRQGTNVAEEVYQQRAASGLELQTTSYVTSMLQDFIRIKRTGTTSPLLNTAAAGFAVLIILLTVWSFRSRHGAAMALCGWFMVSWSQTMFGIFQFTAYQRSGWELVMGATVLGAAALTIMQSFLPQRLQHIGTGIVCLFAISAFSHPPGHTFIMSSTENALIKAARAAPWQAYVSSNQQAVLLKRRYSNFHGGQGDPFMSVVEPADNVRFQTVGHIQDMPQTLDTNTVYITLIDPARTLTLKELGTWAAMNPGAAEDFIAHQHDFYQWNDLITNRMHGMANQRWELKRIELQDGLYMQLYQFSREL